MKKVDNLKHINRVLDSCVYVLNNFDYLPAEFRTHFILQLWLFHCRTFNSEINDTKDNR